MVDAAGDQECTAKLLFIGTMEGPLEGSIPAVSFAPRTVNFMGAEQYSVTMVICEDDVDTAILQCLMEAGDEGILPRDLAKDLPHYKLDQGNFTHRIQRMNRRLERKVGKRVAEKRGEKWVITTFMRNLLGISGNKQ